MIISFPLNFILRKRTENVVQVSSYLDRDWIAKLHVTSLELYQYISMSRCPLGSSFYQNSPPARNAKEYVVAIIYMCQRQDN
jgi:hypothetical protein